MSYNSPIAFEINNPLLADKAAQEIQTALRDAPETSWLQLSFGRARVGKKREGETTITYPETQQTFGTDYYNLFPNDNVISQSYVLIQNEVVEAVAEAKDIVNWTADCSVIFFIRNLDEIDTSKQANIEQWLRRDIQKVLATKARSFTFTGWQDELEDVYSEFSFDTLNAYTKTDHKKYAYFRANGTVTYRSKCYEDPEYDPDVEIDPFQAIDFIYGGENFLQQP